MGQFESVPNPPSESFGSISVSKSGKPATLPQSKIAIVFACAVSLKTKAETIYFSVPGTGK